MNYESVPRYHGVFEMHNPTAKAHGQGNESGLQPTDYYVEKMRFPSKNDKTKIIYNGTYFYIPHIFSVEGDKY